VELGGGGAKEGKTAAKECKGRARPMFYTLSYGEDGLLAEESWK